MSDLFGAADLGGSSALLGHLLEDISDLVVVTDETGRMVFVSPSLEQVLGFTPDEWVGQVGYALLHPDDLDAVREPVRRARADGVHVHRYTVNCRVRHATGEWRHLEGKGTLRRKGEGGGLSSMTVLRDVTEAVVAHRELSEHIEQVRERKDWFESLVRHISDVIVLMDESAVLQYVSPSIEQMLGYEPASLIEVNALDLVHPDDVSHVVEAIEYGNRDPAAAQIPVEFRLRDAHGEIHDVESLSSVLERDGEHVVRVLTVRDVTDRKHAEEELRTNEERLRTLAELAPIGIFQSDPVGLIQYANDRWREFYGVDETIEPGIAFTAAAADAIHPDDLALVDAAWGDLALHGKPVVLQYRARRGDGTGWLRVRTAPLRSSNGELIGHVGSVEDVTDLVQANEELRVSQQEAKLANEAKSQFLSRMSHELRTPLNSIIGFAQLLALRNFEGDDAEAVELILRGGRHLLDLINEVLDISRIEAGSLGLALEPVDVRRLVTESLAMLRPQATTHEVTLHADDEHLDGLAVEADPQRLQQVLANLLSNAIKYNRPGGSVTVAAAPQDDGTIAVAVHDTGRGIAPELLHRVFEPFDRLGADAWGIEGAGIGLTLSKALVDDMGGTLSTESVAGVGTTFTVRLPAASGSPASEH